MTKKKKNPRGRKKGVPVMSDMVARLRTLTRLVDEFKTRLTKIQKAA